MEFSFVGGCACGAVRYECRVPTLDIFTSSAQPWDHLNPELPKLPRGLE